MVLPLVAKISSAGYPKEESVTVIVTNLIDIYEITLQKDVQIFLAYNFYLVKNYKSSQRENFQKLMYKLEPDLSGFT